MCRVLIFVTVAATVSLFPVATGAGGFGPHHPDHALFAATAHADVAVVAALRACLKEQYDVEAAQRCQTGLDAEDPGAVEAVRRGQREASEIIGPHRVLTDHVDAVGAVVSGFQAAVKPSCEGSNQVRT